MTLPGDGDTAGGAQPRRKVDPFESEPPVIEGEIVDDEPRRRGPSGSTGRFAPGYGDSPFQGAGGAGTPIGGFTIFGLSGSGGGGRIGMADAMRMLGDTAPQVRGMLALPLRILSIAVAVPAVGALLLSIGLDGVPRWLAWVLAAGGAAAVVLLEVRRKRMLAGSAPAAGDDATAPARTSTTAARGRAGKVGLPLLIGGSLLWMMLTGGFDLLAILLMLFGAW
ncbi:hypothetical protein [Nakamurella aerolata]|uniref:Uncharacterized protein n=1 Tax=Nakamurella aerolata TaxID=1656892 RepID=A0A849A771_9ACTN|nr:hypothetical protein [Nakamurella aerolata]NNG34350.1 hypothetical protein [Nakamurella aerolata]